MLLLLCACDSVRSVAGSPVEMAQQNGKTAAIAAPHAPLWPPRTWVYWLQNMQPAELAEVSVELAVIDHAADGRDETAYPPETIAALQNSGKAVLCYFSIGEAENYRSYWRKEWKKNPPAFLGPENPRWKGNFKVRYWDDSWWSFVLQPYLDSIIRQGFDGVYLDIIDAYWFWHEEHGMEVADTADRMIDLVVRIADYARKHDARVGRGRFVICPQNAEGIISDGSKDKVARYIDVIDAIGVESLFFNTSKEDRAYRMKLLQRFAAAGRPVLNIEYIKPSKRDEYKRMLQRNAFPVVGYIASPDAALDKLGMQP